MSSPLRIPPRYVPGLLVLANMKDETFAELRAALQQVPQLLTTERLAEHVRSEVPALSDEAVDTLEALLSLITLLPEDGEGAADLSRDVAQSRDLDLADPAREALADRLPPLLVLESLSLAARASDLITEYDRVFHDARILNDLRPVFGPNPSDGPKAALLVATLKIDYHVAGGPLDSTYFALDYSDLLRLRDVVDRALAKHASLRGSVEKMNLPYWEYREPPDATRD